MDWDLAYSNSDHVAESASFPPRWQAEAAAFRTEHAECLQPDISYGPSDRQRFDLFRPDNDARGLAIFVHGGYWHKMEKESFSHLASGALARGWAVALPGYDLCPQVRVRDITQQLRAAVTLAAEHVPGPIALAGHSAGGHLVSRMACRDLNLPEPIARRLQRIVSISGVHDLRPLLRTKMNTVLRLDSEEATAESPGLLEPRDSTDLLCWVGGAELPEFLRQNALLANIWTGLGVRTAAHEAPAKHHFNVIEDLRDPESVLVDEWLKG